MEDRKEAAALRNSYDNPLIPGGAKAPPEYFSGYYLYIILLRELPQQQRSVPVRKAPDILLR